MHRKKILVLAYMLSPYKGSEFSVAWNYVTNMSRDNDLTVLYGISGAHMGECREMEEYIHKYPIPGVKLIAVYPNQWANLLNWPNRHNLFVYTFYYAYQVWQKLAYKKAKDLMLTERFDLIHYVGMIGYREPGYLWKLGLPYVWGPVSGANNAPWQLFKPMPWSGKLKQGFRTLANKIQFHTKHRLKEALKHTDILLTATSENQLLFEKVHHKKSICLPENGIVGNISLDFAKFVNPQKYKLIVVGTLDARKSVGIFLEALQIVQHKQLLEVDIVGDGPLRKSLEDYAASAGLDSIITWHGQLPRKDAVRLFNSAHLHVITSVSEGNPTTIWEAMSYGVPTLSFDHCGMHDTLRDNAGILIPIAKHYEDCVKNVADVIESLLVQPDSFLQLANKTIQRAQTYTWDKRCTFFNNLYDRLCSKNNII